MTELPTGTATFMFTDIEGSTNLVEALGDEAWHGVLRWHDETLRSLFAEHKGEEVVGTGDLGAQTAQILANMETALAAAGAGLEHVVKWNLLVVEGQDLRTAIESFSRLWVYRKNKHLNTF